MCPEEMERGGTASTFKESATLLHKHYLLFLPFVLAFYLPILILTLYKTVFLSPSFTPLLDASVFKDAVNIAQSSGTCPYIAAYQYTPTDDDRSIVPKVIKLPRLHVFLGTFIIELYVILVFLLLSLLSVIIGGILQAIILATAGWLDPTLFFLFALLPVLVASFRTGAIHSRTGPQEPGNYGREALKRSTKLVRIGRASTIVAVARTGISLTAVLTVPKHGIMTGGCPCGRRLFSE